MIKKKSFMFFLLSYLEELFLFECKGKKHCNYSVLDASITPLGMLLTVFQVHASTKVTDVLRGLNGSSADMTSHNRD